MTRSHWIRHPIRPKLTTVSNTLEGGRMTIKRIWHGWTAPEDAEAYWQVLSTIVIPGIEAKKIEGYRGIDVLRRDHEDEVEFVTMMTFASLQSVRDFTGEDYEQCYVPEPAQAVLKRWDLRSAHFEVLDERVSPPT